MFFHYKNLGCKVNQIESEKIAKDLTRLGYKFTRKIEESDFVVINTCTVTEKADKKSWQVIKKCNRQASLKKIFITGCYSELEKDLPERLSDKNVIIAQSKKNDLATIVDDILRLQFGYKSHVPDYANKWEAFKSSRIFTHHLNNDQDSFFKYQRAFLKIQDGCNAFCTYCRIPFARGAPVSRSAQDILQQVKQLDRKKTSEIVLTGINIGTYFDKKNELSFGQLVEEILSLCSFSKIRISSLEPQSIKEDFLKNLGHKNLLPHFHLPLQGSSNRILKLMKRRYQTKDFKALLDYIRLHDPFFSISTDVIVGFPGESEEEFQEGLQFIRSCRFSKIHVFPFSFRPLSPLADNALLKKVAPKVIKRRISVLQALSEELFLKHTKKLQEIKQRFVLEELIDSTAFTFYNQNSSLSYPLEKYDFFKGTTDYYVKGVLPVLKNSKKEGDISQVVIHSLSPLVFHSL